MVPGRWGSQISQQSAHVGGEVVYLTHQPPWPPGNIPGTHFCWGLSQPQGHSVVGRIMSLKKSNGTNGNRTRDLPACSTVPQPTAPPSANLLVKCCEYRQSTGRKTRSQRRPPQEWERILLLELSLSLLYLIDFKLSQGFVVNFYPIFGYWQ